MHVLSAAATHAIEVRHSRFLAQAVPIAAAEAAMPALAQFAAADATHNCWAYRFGALYRSGDDGEPAGTAGRPILAAIDAQGFDRVLVVVSRWYGGIKLGAGGLARAYGGVAAQCVRLAPRQPLIAMARTQLVCGFADCAQVHTAIAAFGAEKLAETFAAEGVHFALRLPADRLEALKDRLRDATRDRVRFEDNG